MMGQESWAGRMGWSCLIHTKPVLLSGAQAESALLQEAATIPSVWRCGKVVLGPLQELGGAMGRWIMWHSSKKLHPAGQWQQQNKLRCARESRRWSWSQGLECVVRWERGLLLWCSAKAAGCPGWLQRQPGRASIAAPAAQPLPRWLGLAEAGITIRKWLGRPGGVRGLLPISSPKREMFATNCLYLSLSR